MKGNKMPQASEMRKVTRLNCESYRQRVLESKGMREIIRSIEHSASKGRDSTVVSFEAGKIEKDLNMVRFILENAGYQVHFEKASFRKPYSNSPESAVEVSWGLAALQIEGEISIAVEDLEILKQLSKREALLEEVKQSAVQSTVASPATHKDG